MLTVRLSVEGGKFLTAYSAYAPTSGNNSAARQAFYDDVSVQTRSENQSDILAVFIDGSASMGVGALPGTWERGDPRALGPWGNRHVNAAGQEMREWLHVVGRRGREARAAGAWRDVCAPRPSRARSRTAWQPEGRRAMQCFCRDRVRARRSAARAAGAGRDVCAPTRGRDRVEREPGQRGNHRDNVRCNVSAAIGFEHDEAQREQRGRGATCAHRPADETKSSESQVAL